MARLLDTRADSVRRLVVAGALLLASGAAARGATAQSASNTGVTAAGEQYRAGLFQRWILGRHYRDLWTTPVEVEYLDLRSFAGGLEPLRTGGGQQTRSLRFTGADGREYAFRSVDKDPSPVLDSILHDTFVDDLVQDGISAAHPYGALVAAPLLDAVGVLHVDPQLALMPDDPALGEFREEFAGMLGLIEERPDENEGERTSFRGAERVIGSERLTERLEEGPADRVDARAFLTARLMDVFLGDWDRHRGQWRWASYEDDAPRSWLPVPRDRDQAFSKFDGAATRIVSLYMPQFVRFGEEYPSLKRLHWNARALDRWFLAELDRAAWDSVGASVQAALTDELIDEAVRTLPPEIRAISSEELSTALRARRDRLPEAWEDFYRLLSREAEVRATDEDEVVVVDRSTQGTVSVTMALQDRPDSPYFSRTFDRAETREIRIHLNGGDDAVRIGGDAETGILVRVVGGRGDDRFEFDGPGSGTRIYDQRGDNEVVGTGAPELDERDFEEWVWTEEDRDQPQDWGGWTYPAFWTSYSSDLGLFLGGGARIERHGFRKRPYSSRWDLRAGYAPTVRKGRVEIDARFYAENSALFWTLGTRVSRLDVLHYYGLGNQPASGDRSFHEVDLTSTAASVGLGLSPSPGLEWSVDVTLERSSTRETTDTFFGTLGPLYGRGEFFQLGARTELVVDPWADATDVGHRLRLRVHGGVSPPMLDVERTFGRAGAELSALLASSPWPWVSLGLQAGGERVFGRFPWHEAAFLGGSSTLSAYDEQRFAGDAAAFGSAELRLTVWRPRVVVPSAIGVFGLVEAGRVYVDGDSPGGWTTGAGGGLYLHPVLQPYVLRLGVAAGAERTRAFLTLGLPY